MSNLYYDHSICNLRISFSMYTVRIGNIVEMSPCKQFHYVHSYIPSHSCLVLLYPPHILIFFPNVLPEWPIKLAPKHSDMGGLVGGWIAFCLRLNVLLMMHFTNKCFLSIVCNDNYVNGIWGQFTVKCKLSRRTALINTKSSAVHVSV